MMTRYGERLEFVELAMLEKSDQCLIWPYSLRSGYPALNGTYAHIEVCRRANGPRPSHAHQAAHGCNVKKCVNPRHLRWATPKENCADREAHTDNNRGQKHNMAKLRDDDVRYIRASNKTGVLMAEKYGVSTALISLIRNFKIWKHLD